MAYTKVEQARYSMLFQQALDSPLGIMIHTSDASRLCQALNYTKKKLAEKGIDDYAELKIRTLQPLEGPEQVIIIKSLDPDQIRELMQQERKER